MASGLPPQAPTVCRGLKPTLWGFGVVVGLPTGPNSQEDSCATHRLSEHGEYFQIQ